MAKPDDLAKLRDNRLGDSWADAALFWRLDVAGQYWPRSEILRATLR